MDSERDDRLRALVSCSVSAVFRQVMVMDCSVVSCDVTVLLPCPVDFTQTYSSTVHS